MRLEHLKYLVCPTCKNGLLPAEILQQHDDRIETGVLACSGCSAKYDIVHFIPRFVPNDNYASTFGFQWLKHARTQIDSHNGTHISETRLFEETEWPHQLAGQVILEVGSGSGRFTEPLAVAEAMVVSLDYSQAVEANYSANGLRENVLIVQGDIYQMPVPKGYFDKVLCIGVLQHTPDIEKAFKTLPGYLKPGGSLAIDVYAKGSGLRGFLRHLLKTRYWVRPLTRRIKPEKLYRYCAHYINWMWPIARIISTIPRFGSRINWFLLIPDYRSGKPLPDSLLKEWAILDLFDILSPTYDRPQTIETVKRWFQETGLTDIEVEYGYNGIEGRGTNSANCQAKVHL
jgi:SAM-dependent methyltransferase